MSFYVCPQCGYCDGDMHINCDCGFTNQRFELNFNCDYCQDYFSTWEEAKRAKVDSDEKVIIISALQYFASLGRHPKLDTESGWYQVNASEYQAFTAYYADPANQMTIIDEEERTSEPLI